MADRVRKLSGNPKYTQQSFQKFENNPDGKTSYLVYIIQALEEAEQKQVQNNLVQESSAQYATEVNDSALALIRRISQLSHSGDLNNADLALIAQLVERLAKSNQ